MSVNIFVLYFYELFVAHPTNHGASNIVTCAEASWRNLAAPKQLSRRVAIMRKKRRSKDSSELDNVK